MNKCLARFFNFFGGRSFTLALLAFAIGVLLAFNGKLTYEYIGLVGALQGLVTYRAVQADKTNGNNGSH